MKSNIKRAGLLFAFLCGVTAFSEIAFAEKGGVGKPSADIEALVNQVDSLFVGELPGIQEVIPGYKIAQNTTPGVVIADFQDISEKENIHWGKVAAQLMRFHLSYIPEGHLRTPSFHHIYIDKKNPPIKSGISKSTVNEARYLGQSMNMENVITGVIQVDDSGYRIDLELRDTKSGLVVKDKFSSSGAKENLNEGLVSLSKSIHSRLVKKTTAKAKAYFLKELKLKDINLDKLAEVLTKVFLSRSTRERRMLLKPFWKAEKTEPFIVYHYIEYMRGAQNTEDTAVFNQLLRELLKENEDSRSMLFLVGLKTLANQNTANTLNRKTRWLTKYTRMNPEDVEGFIALSETLFENELSFNALRVMAQGVRVHPKNFRALWIYAQHVKKQAYDERGTKYWKYVPERGKRLFPPLMELANKIAGIGTSLNRVAVGMRTEYLSTLVGYSPEVMSEFYEILKLDPHHRPLYRYTIKKVVPQWKGSQKLVDTIWKLAIKNNPDEVWPYEMRDGYARKKSSKRDSLSIWMILKTLMSVILLAMSFREWWKSGFWFPNWLHYTAGASFIIGIGLAFFSDKVSHSFADIDQWFPFLFPLGVYISYLSLGGGSAYTKRIGDSIQYHASMEKEDVLQIFKKSIYKYTHLSPQEFTLFGGDTVTEYPSANGRVYELEIQGFHPEDEKAELAIDFTLRPEDAKDNVFAFAQAVMDKNGRLLQNPLEAVV